MKKLNNIISVFVNSSGLFGHTDISYLFEYPQFRITNMRNVFVDDKLLLTDIYIDYLYVSGTTFHGTASIYNHDIITTTTTTLVPTTTTTTLVPTTTTTTLAPTTTTTTTIQSQIPISLPFSPQSLRIIPNTIISDSTIKTAIESEVDSPSIDVISGSTEIITLQMPATPLGGLFTYNIISSVVHNWTILAEKSIDSTDGTDGTWSTITLTPFFDLDIPLDLQKIELPIENDVYWLKVTLTNNNDVDDSLSSIGLRYYSETGDDDYWLVFGASLMSGNVKHSLINASVKSVYGDDPVVFNLGYPGKTEGWLNDNVELLLSAHTHAKFALLHIGGNSVSRDKPYSSLTPEEISGINLSYRGIFEKVDNAGVTLIPMSVSFRDYPNEPDVELGCYGGGLPEYGSEPFNENIFVRAIEDLTPQFYDSTNNIPIIDLYTHVLNNQQILSTDGVHWYIATEGEPFITNVFKDTVFKYIYTNVYPIPETPLQFNTPYEDADDKVTIAEGTRLPADVVVAQEYVDLLTSGWTLLYDSVTIQVLQDRIDAIVVLNIFEHYVDFGKNTSLTTGNWNNIIDIAQPSVELINIAGDLSGIYLSILSGNTFTSTTSGSLIRLNDLPQTMCDDSFNVRGYISIDSIIELSSLNPLKKYNINIYTIDDTLNQVIIDVTISGITKSQNASQNTTVVLSFNDILPDVNNKILINFNTSDNYAYLSGMLIQEF